MIKKYFEYIVIGLILLVFVQGFFSVPEGISETELMYQLEVQRLNNDKMTLIKKYNDLKILYNETQNEITSDSSVIWKSNRRFNDSIRSIVNPR